MKMTIDIPDTLMERCKTVIGRDRGDLPQGTILLRNLARRDQKSEIVVQLGYATPYVKISLMKRCPQNKRHAIRQRKQTNVWVCNTRPLLSVDFLTMTEANHPYLAKNLNGVAHPDSLLLFRKRPVQTGASPQIRLSPYRRRGCRPIPQAPQRSASTATSKGSSTDLRLCFASTT